jgi:hypothetical protein
MNKEEERRLARKIVRGVGKEFRSRGFLHSKPTWLVRPLDGFAQFVHFHKFTFGPRFRVHLGIRVMNDPFEAVALNGPSFEHAGRYEADEEETLACTRTLIVLIERDGLPWLSALSDIDGLLQSPRSPLKDRDRQALTDDLAGKQDEARWQVSERLLGLTNAKV